MSDKTEHRARTLAAGYWNMADKIAEAADPIDSPEYSTFSMKSSPQLIALLRQNVNEAWLRMCGTYGANERDRDARLRAELFNMCECCADNISRIADGSYDVDRATDNAISNMRGYVDDVDGETMNRIRACRAEVRTLVATMAKKPGKTSMKSAFEALFNALGWQVSYENFKATMRVARMQQKRKNPKA